MFEKTPKRLIVIIIVVIVLVCSYIWQSSISYASNEGAGRRNRNYSDTTIIVKYKDDVGGLKQWVTNVLNGAEEKHKIGQSRENVRVLRVKKGKTVEEVLERYMENSDVEYAEPDYICYLNVVPNDLYYSANQSSTYNLLNIPLAWDYTIGSNDIITAVVDSGVNYNHVDLTGRIIKGYDFGQDTSDPMDNDGHGTFVSGIIAANTNNRNRSGGDYMAK